MKKSDKKTWVIILSLVIVQLALITIYAYSNVMDNLAMPLISLTFLPVAILVGTFFAKLNYLSKDKKHAHFLAGVIAGVLMFVLSVLVFLPSNFIAQF
jgi:FlaA1/EpsC-like NDP-sugar epimerase